MTAFIFHIWLLVFIALSSLPFIIDQKNKQLDVFNPRNIFILFYLSYYGIRTMDLYYSTYPLSFLDLTDQTLKKNLLISALEISIMGLLCFYAGYYSKIAHHLERHLTVFKHSKWDRKRSGHIVIGLFALGVGISLYLFQKGGGIFYYISNINYVRLWILSDVGYLKYIVNLLSIAVLIATINYCIKEKGKLWLLLLAGISVFLNLVVAHRWAAIQTILYILIIRNYWYKKLTLRTITIVLFTALVFNIAYGSYRAYTETVEVGAFQTDLGSAGELSEDEIGLAGLFFTNIWAHFHGTDSLLYTTSQLQQQSADKYHYGLYFLQDFLTIAVPRFLWPEKSNPSHVKFNNIIHGEDPNHYDPDEKAGGIVQTILGEFYWAGGYIGISIGMFLVGCMCKILYLYFTHNRYNPFIMMVYCVSVVHVFTINGAFSITVNKWLYLMITILLSITYISINIGPRMSQGNEHNQSIS